MRAGAAAAQAGIAANPLARAHAGFMRHACPAMGAFGVDRSRAVAEKALSPACSLGSILA